MTILKKTLPFILTLIGVVLFCILTLRTGLHSIFVALGKVGWGGFVLLVFSQLIVNFFLGLSWKSSIKDISFLRLTAARFIRDAASVCLPFSQLGGMIIGIRATIADTPKNNKPQPSLGWPEGVAANLIDITTEVLSQIAFIILALLCLIGHADSGRFIWPLAIAMILLSFGMAGFIWTQQHGSNLVNYFSSFLEKYISARWHESFTGNTETFQHYLNSLWSHPVRIACSAALHLLCWCGSAFITWLSLRLLGAHLTFFDTVAIEGAVCGIVSAGFLVPGSLGVQEGAYVALGLIFGIPSDMAFSLSLLRRGRDVVIGIPVLLFWQFCEFRHLRRHQKNTSPSS